MKNETLKELLFLHDFINENKKAGKLSKQQSEEIERIWNNYKSLKVSSGYSIIDADFGTLGSLVIREVESSDFDNDLKYKSGSYDYVSIVTKNTKRILWTDYSDTEPYNRSSGLYCSGASFDSLGPPVIQKPDYREFNSTCKYQSNITFGVWGFDFNDFYGSVRFGICIETKLVDAFIGQIRTIINK